MKAANKPEKDIEKAIKIKNEKEIKELEKRLKEDYTDQLVKQLIESEKKRRENGTITELQKIMDVVYLKLRGYSDDFYPLGVRAFVTDHLEPVAKKIFDCKTTADVLKVAEEIYEVH